VSYEIRPAQPHELAALPELERQAASRFAPYGLAEVMGTRTTPLAAHQAAQAEGRVWVAAEVGGPVVGFALASRVPSDDTTSPPEAHLDELDVLEAHGRRGLGRGLVDAVVAWARTHHARALTLSTLRDIPWNAPYYRKLGFEARAPASVPRALALQLAAEAARGLPSEGRVLMSRPLTPVPTLSATRRGAGAPVVLVHSGGMSSRQWRRLGELLEPAYAVIAPDLIGYGTQTEWPAGQPFDYREDVLAVAALCRTLEQPAHVVGHSYGGLVALTLARQYPTLARSVAVYDPVAFGLLRDVGDASLAALDQPATRGVLDDPALSGTELWMQTFVEYWSGAGSWAALSPEARASFLHVGHKVFAEVRSLADDRTPLSAYAGLHQSALFLYGERSPPPAHRIAALLGATAPRGVARCIEGAGHMGPITHAPAVLAALVPHLAR
jgi:pimeloyl-ACP methyl ester carboxylesterase/GNAT superfamily N-acetyltransferase